MLEHSLSQQAHHSPQPQPDVHALRQHQRVPAQRLQDSTPSRADEDRPQEAGASRCDSPACSAHPCLPSSLLATAFKRCVQRRRGSVHTRKLTCAVCVRHMHFLARRAKKYVKSTDVLRVHREGVVETLRLSLALPEVGGWKRVGMLRLSKATLRCGTVCVRACVCSVRGKGKKWRLPHLGLGSHAALTCSWGCAV